MFDYFWIGNLLENGAFIQFGYGFQPGPANYCLKGIVASILSTCTGHYEPISNLEARWEWQYWPSVDGQTFYYEIGPANSIGLNASWHEYSIVSSESEWHFKLDGTEVGNLTAGSTVAREPPMMIAEKLPASGTNNLLGSLGPTEFRNLQYLKTDGWHTVETLIASLGCSNCADQPYGVVVVGPNDVVIGSVHEEFSDGELLWTSGYSILNVTTTSGAKFSISTLIDRHQFVAGSEVAIPKGMFAYISLIDTSVPLQGITGMLGSTDEFQQWTGCIMSTNQTLQILMDRDCTLTATWRANFTVPTLLLGAIISILIAIEFWTTRKKIARAN
jgi:hypothetical protein